MKSNDRTRPPSNPDFDGITLLLYIPALTATLLQVCLTLGYYSRVRRCLPSVLSLDLQHTPLHPTSPVGPTCLGSPNLTTTIPTRYPNLPNNTSQFCTTSLLLHSYPFLDRSPSRIAPPPAHATATATSQRHYAVSAS